MVRPDTAQATQMLRMRTLYPVGSGNGEAGHGPGHPDADGYQHHQAYEQGVSGHRR